MQRLSSRLRRALVLRGDNLGQRVVRGAGFQFLGIALRTVITIGSVAILARLLTPADFGYVAMATVVTEFAALFANFGLNAMLVQRRRISRLQVDTVFWASAAIGVLLAALVWALSWVSKLWFAEALVGDLLRWLALVFVISGLNVIPGVILSRLLLFRLEFFVSISTVVIRTVAAIASAWWGLGVWSLVVGALVGAVAQLVLSYAVAPYLPRLRFHAAYLAGTWRTSSSYFGSGLLYYANMNIDLMLVGRYLGATPLGHYQTARTLTDEIRSRIAIPLQHVLFPALSAMQAERERLQMGVIRSSRLMAAVLVPIGVGVAATAPELVPVLYGSKWVPMVPVMSMFGLSAALRAGTAIAGPLFNACNRVGLALKYNLVGSALLVAGVVVALPYGLDAVATAVAVTSMFTLLTFRIALGLIGLDTGHMLSVLGAPTLASAAMWLAIHAFRSFAEASVGDIGVLLAANMIIGTTVYLAALHLLSRDLLREFVQLARRFAGPNA